MISVPIGETLIKHLAAPSNGHFKFNEFETSRFDSMRLVDFLEKDTFQSKSCADQLKALSEPLRLRIVDILRQGERSVGELATALETELVTVSHHLKILKHAGLIEVQREGRFMVYRLRDDLLQLSADRNQQFLNLGCCRIEVPEKPKSKS